MLIFRWRPTFPLVQLICVYPPACSGVENSLNMTRTPFLRQLRVSSRPAVSCVRRFSRFSRISRCECASALGTPPCGVVSNRFYVVRNTPTLHYENRLKTASSCRRQFRRDNFCTVPRRNGANSGTGRV